MESSARSGTRLPLGGRGILITRPRAQAAGFADRVAEAGGVPLVFPTVEIAPPGDPEALAATLARLGGFDLAIFISPTAVEEGLRAARAAGAWPPGLRVAAVGPGTRAALEREGFSGVLSPDHGADAESLLREPALQDLAGRGVIVFRGEGGREALGRMLAARGARLEHAVCYRRVKPALELAPLLEAWDAGRVHAVTAFSARAFLNLAESLAASLPGTGERLGAMPCFVSHEAIATRLAAAGFPGARVAGPDGASMLAALVAYFSPRK